MVKIKMDVFVKKYQPDVYELWRMGMDTSAPLIHSTAQQQQQQQQQRTQRRRPTNNQQQQQQQQQLVSDSSLPSSTAASAYLGRLDMSSLSRYFATNENKSAPTHHANVSRLEHVQAVRARAYDLMLSADGDRQPAAAAAAAATGTSRLLRQLVNTWMRRMQDREQQGNADMHSELRHQGLRAALAVLDAIRCELVEPTSDDGGDDGGDDDDDDSDADDGDGEDSETVEIGDDCSAAVAVAVAVTDESTSRIMALNRQQSSRYPHCSVCLLFASSPPPSQDSENMSVISCSSSSSADNRPLPVNSAVIVGEQCFRKKQSACGLERLVDLTSQLEASVSSPPSPTLSLPSRRAGGVDKIDVLLRCKECALCVHQNCYAGSTSDELIYGGGGAAAGQHNWMCDKCLWMMRIRQRRRQQQQQQQQANNNDNAIRFDINRPIHFLNIYCLILVTKFTHVFEMNGGVFLRS